MLRYYTHALHRGSNSCKWKSERNSSENNGKSDKMFVSKGYSCLEQSESTTYDRECKL